MAFNLETLEKRKPLVDLNEYNFTFYGGAGQGKTTTASYFFDDPIFFAWERGQNAVEAYVIDMYSWKDLIQFIRQATKMKKNGKDFPFKNIIIDTVDIMRDECEKHVCMENGWDSPADGNMGAGWAEVRREFEDRLKDLEMLGFKYHFIAHDKTQHIERKDIAYDKITLQLGSTAVNAVIKAPDFVVYFDKEFFKDQEGNVASKRVIRLDGGENYEAKARITGLPEVIDCGSSAKETAEILKNVITDRLKEIAENGETIPEKEKSAQRKQRLEHVDYPEQAEVSNKALEKLNDEAVNAVKDKRIKVEDVTRLLEENTSVERIMEISKKTEYDRFSQSLRDLLG